MSFWKSSKVTEPLNSSVNFNIYELKRNLSLFICHKVKFILILSGNKTAFMKTKTDFKDYQVLFSEIYSSLYLINSYYQVRS